MNAPAVQKTTADALRLISASGKATGKLSLKDSATPPHLENGAHMIGVASNALKLNTALRKKARKWSERT
ncbi:MAG: hypothetical protein P8I83_00615 [Paracoccaceae bacterium]|nr:hypothetical protein [Paracoccaceae bacterium]